jgi:hypothetical protein
MNDRVALALAQYQSIIHFIQRWPTTGGLA